MNIQLDHGFFLVLTIIFITLKLCGIIAWSWWLVLSPILIGLAIATVVVLIAVSVCVCAKFSKK